MATTNSGKQAPSKHGNSAASGAFTISKEPVVHGRSEEDVHKYEATREPSAKPAFEELGELPRGYGANTLYLIARDPHWLFTYWDLDWTQSPASTLRDRKVFLKILQGEGGEESTIEI